MALLGVGMGLIASQLGNVVQSAVGAGDRSEAGGLQYTLQQLGSSLGVALVGAIVLTGLIQHVGRQRRGRSSTGEVAVEAVQLTVDGDVSFVPADDRGRAAPRPPACRATRPTPWSRRTRTPSSAP